MEGNNVDFTFCKCVVGRAFRGGDFPLSIFYMFLSRCGGKFIIIIGGTLSSTLGNSTEKGEIQSIKFMTNA